MHNNISIGDQVEQEIAKNYQRKHKNTLNLKIQDIEMDMIDKAGQPSNLEHSAPFLLKDKDFGRVLAANLEKPVGKLNYLYSYSNHLIGWYGTESNPSQKGLEFSLLDVEGLKLLYNKKMSKKEKEYIKVPFEALHTRICVKSMTINSRNGEKFHVRIDDNYYGPYHQYEVRPFELENNSHYSIPLMCFLPGTEM